MGFKKFKGGLIILKYCKCKKYKPNSVFDCNKCGEEDKGGGNGGWSVNTQLWEKTILDNGHILEVMLCINCFENILGRKLTKIDFTDTLDNKTNSVVQKYYY